MRKLLVALFSLALIFAFSGCGDTEATDDSEASPTIPLGENLPDYPLEGAAYGNGDYSVIDTPEWLVYEAASSETVYYSDDADVPYIVVYRWSADGKTLEENAEYVAENFSLNSWYDTYEQDGYTYTDIFSDSQTFGLTDADAFYYVETMSTMDGEEIVSIDFYHATEELALGDSGKYLWVPTGYNDSVEDITEHNAYISAVYDGSYYMPYIFVSEDPTGDYEDVAWNWNIIYPDGLPFDEKTYNSWVENNWDDASVDAYYEALNIDVTYTEEREVDGCEVNLYSCTYTEEDVEYKMVDSYIHFDDESFNFFIATSADPAPAYFNSILSSLHSK